MYKAIKTGVLSYGMSGKLFHGPFLQLHDGFDFSAIVERSVKKARLDFPDVTSYDSVDELMNDPEVELVVINTPNATHFEFALHAIRQGKHVLIEKPFAVDAAQARALFEEAENHNRCILAYQNRRYDSDIISVKEVMDSGKLGDLVEVHFRYDRYVPKLSPIEWKETPSPGSGIAYNLGAHLIDQALWLFGTPSSYTRHPGSFRQNSQVDDYAHFHLSYPSGLQVSLTMSLHVADPGPAFILHGTKGSYYKQRTDVQEAQLQGGIHPDDPVFGVENSGDYGLLTTISEDGSKTEEQIAANKSTYLNVFDDVYRTIRENKPYPVTPEQIVKQLEIIAG
ncbi:MAG: Gfo/Idh/MocA family oxidoreductase [Cyclobacteriaceae bacterium]